MTHQISRVSIHQTAKVLAVVYGVLGLLFVPFLWLGGRADPEGAMPGWVVVLFPVLYAVFGYIATAVGAAVYNAISRRIGGVEFELTQTS